MSTAGSFPDVWDWRVILAAVVLVVCAACSPPDSSDAGRAADTVLSSSQIMELPIAQGERALMIVNQIPLLDLVEFPFVLRCTGVF